MGKLTDLLPEKISEISALLKFSNFSQRKIARLTNVSVMSINRIKQKLQRNISLGSNRKGKCGRLRITTPRDERRMNKIFIDNRRKSTNALTEIMNKNGISISPRTARRRLSELGFHCCRPARKPKLTPFMKQKRLQWAQKHRHMTVADWEKVIIL